MIDGKLLLLVATHVSVVSCQVGTSAVPVKYKIGSQAKLKPILKYI